MRSVQRKIPLSWLSALLVTGASFGQVAGDLDGNGRVDYRDAFLLSLHWHSPQADYPGADLSGGGGVTDADLLAFRGVFGQIYSPTRTYNIRDYVAFNFGDEWRFVNHGLGAGIVHETALPGPRLRDRNNVLQNTVKLQSDYMGLERYFGFRGGTLALFRVSVLPEGLPAMKDIDLKPEVDWGNDAVRIGDRFHTSSSAMVPLPGPGGTQVQTVFLEVDVTYLAAGEPVVVPAGRFLDTLKVEVRATAQIQGQATELSAISGNFWYARGVGEVKRLDLDGNLMELQSAFIGGVTIP